MNYEILRELAAWLHLPKQPVRYKPRHPLSYTYKVNENLNPHRVIIPRFSHILHLFMRKKMMQGVSEMYTAHAIENMINAKIQTHQGDWTFRTPLARPLQALNYHG